MARSTLGIDEQTHRRFNQIKVEIAAQMEAPRIPKTDSILTALIAVGRRHIPEIVAEMKSE